MSAQEKSSLLKIDLETVDPLLREPREVIFNSEYLQDNEEHMKEVQPRLAELLEKQSFLSPEEMKFFRAGSLSTYDLIYSADPDYWDEHALTYKVLYNAQKNFTDSSLMDESNMVKVDRKRIVTNVEWFYEKLTKDSPRYSEWLEWVTFEMRPEERKDFLYGSLLTAMPFYLTREGEKLYEIFGELA